MEIEEERNFIYRFKSGDESAFNELFEAYHRQVMALAFRFASNESLALDIAQEVFLLAFKELHFWRGEARFKTWLHRTTINVSLSHIRHERVQQRFKQTEACDASSPAMDELAIQHDISSSIECAVSSLPPRQRSVFKLRRYADLSISEIASRLKISEAGAKASYYKAILTLRFLLRPMVCI